MRPVPEITSEQENFRLEPLAEGAGFEALMVKRDPVEPVPVGTYVAKVFRITGYDQDCDGSLMVRLAAVDRKGKETGWEPTHLGLYPDTAVILDDPEELWHASESGGYRYRLELRKCRLGWEGKKILLGESYGGLDLEEIGGMNWRPTRQMVINMLNRQIERERRSDRGPDEVLHA